MAQWVETSRLEWLMDEEQIEMEREVARAAA
jgi:hypothetical protein